MIFSLFGGDKKRISQMVNAARTGDTESIEQLLLQGADINAPEPSTGDTPLIASIDKEQWDTVNYLLEQGPDLSLEDKNGNTPLYLAVSRGAPVEMVVLLLDAGAPVDLGPSHGNNAGASPLHAACATGANECIEILLRNGASATRQLQSGTTPLHASAIGGDQRTVELLCKSGANIDSPNNELLTPLHYCGMSGNAKVAAALIQHEATIDVKDAEGCTPLMRAVLRNHVSVVKVLLENGANPNVLVDNDESKFYPLFVAATNGFDEIVQALLENGADLTPQIFDLPSPLDVAKDNGHDVAVKMIAAAIKKQKSKKIDLSTAATRGRDLWQLIVKAVAQKKQDILQSLVKDKSFSSLSVEDRLLAGCALGDAKIVREMLQAGADPNKACEVGLDGVTPLVMTLGISGSVEVATLLINEGANVNDLWGNGNSPIFETVTDQKYKLAELLINNGADINVSMSNGLTPLMLAVRNGALSCIDLFLNAGAKINALEQEHNLGAFGLAINKLDLKLAEYLLSRGAEPNFGTVSTLPLAVAEYGTLSFIQALDALGCNLVTESNSSRISFVSARNSDPEVFDYLLNHGADPQAGNDFGYTPLILAALNNHHHLIRRYLERGDDATARDVDGETALSLAIEKRHEQSIAVLREFHVEEGTYSSLEPIEGIFKAAEDGALGSVLNLHDSGVPLNCCDDKGNTPLFSAIRAGHHGLVRSLYHLGADINHRNHSGETALSIAKASESMDLINTLQEFGALDAKTGEFAKLASIFGEIPIFNATDTMFGRMSHPYKDKPPYDNEFEDVEFGSDTEDDTNLQDMNSSDEEQSVESEFNLSIESKLERLTLLLNSDEIKEQLPEAVLDQLLQKLDKWRTLQLESELDKDEQDELNHVLDVFARAQADEGSGKSPIFEAVQEQDISSIRKIIKNGGDINEDDGEGNTPLLIAVLMRDVKFVEQLLKLGADPNKSRPDGKGPLFGAIRVGDEKTLKLLIKSGAEVDAPIAQEHNGASVGGCTALYVAAFMGQLTCCKQLLSNGASLEAANDLGYTPLMAAIEGNHEDVIEFFLKSGANVNPAVTGFFLEVDGLGGGFPLYIATRRENFAVIKKLIKLGADVNRTTPNGWTSLKSAAQQGSFEIVKLLLEAGADPNIADSTNYTPLMNAVSGDHEDIVKILLKFKADPNVQCGENPEDEDWVPGRSALMDAAVVKNVGIARELLKFGANPNLITAEGRTALHSAVIAASPEMLTLLLKSGANSNIFGNEEEKISALELALRQWANQTDYDRVGEVTEVLELMLKKAIPTDCSFLNKVALDLVSEGHREVIEVLGKHGFMVDPNFSINGASHLFITAALGDHQLEEAERLLEIGADANFKYPTGLSVLSLATRNGAVRLVKLLLDYGADVMDRNIANALAYDLAVIYGHDMLAEIFIEEMNRIVQPIDVQDEDGNTQLMRSVKSSDINKVKELLALGADASRRDRNGDTPLSYAFINEMDDVVKVLRSSNVETINRNIENGPKNFILLAKQGDLVNILNLIDVGIPIDSTDENGDSAVTAAAVHPGVVKVLAKLGANLSHRNGEGNTAYMIAVASNRVCMIETLKDAGSPINEPEVVDEMTQMQAMLNALEAQAEDPSQLVGVGESTINVDVDDFLMACLSGDALTVSNQIAAGVDINYTNNEGITGLALAIKASLQEKKSRRMARNLEQIIDKLLVAGANPKIGEFSFLIVAALGKRLPLVNSLIKAGASIDAAFGDGQTALFMSLLAPTDGKEADDRCAIALLKAGADSSLRHESGAMPIHLAAASNYVGALEEILTRRPQDVDAKTNTGITPLMQAATEGHAKAVKLLLKFGAEPTLEDNDGLTAKEIAIKNGNEDLVTLLS